MSASAPTSNDIARRALDTLRTTLPPQRPLGLHEPEFGERERTLVLDCLDSGWVSSAGAQVERFEQLLCEHTGMAHAVAMVNGTAALHLGLQLAGVRAGDEVLLPALTFVGSANPVVHCGAVPHFVDCEASSLGIDPAALERHLDAIAEWRGDTCHNRHSGRPLRALLVVHVLGHVADMDALAAIAERYRLALVEDAAEALGSRRNGRHAGSWGRLAALSFNGNKILTTGGGGALLTDDAELAARARHLSTTAKQPHPWAFEHDAVAFNYRLPNLNAALGCAQLEQLEQRLIAKRRLYQRYARAFADLAGAQLHPEPPGCHSNHWLPLLLLPDRDARDALLEAASAEGIGLRPFWTPLHRLPMFADCPHAPLPVTEDLFARGVCLPGSARLGAA